jgi:type II secretory pathway predicted ATPase ExeA/pSer/pThr/pTyr-binding forkhead associated (FHA) protein
MTPDPKFLYLGKAHSRAIAYMEYALWNRDSFVLITGEIGSGKTTLIQKLLSELDKQIVVAKIHQTQLNATEFLQALLVEFGYKPFQAKKVELLALINEYLQKQSARGKQVVVIVDEAQKLSSDVLEEIRMLSSLETKNERIVNVILTGQPELARTLSNSNMEQLNQRIRLRFHIRALKEGEVSEYIEHRLRVAGAENPKLFSADLIPLIYRYTGGIPRLINTLCDAALLVACVEEFDGVDETACKRAIEDLDWMPYQERTKYAAVGHPEFPRHGKLIVSSDEYFIGEYAIDKQCFMIGRTKSNDVQLEGKNVSAFHAMIYHVEGVYWLIDLHSSNGTYVNSKKVTRYALKSDDEFYITKRYQVRFRDEIQDMEGDDEDVTLTGEGEKDRDQTNLPKEESELTGAGETAGIPRSQKNSKQTKTASN